MNAATVTRLNRVNREFYAVHADAFSATRSAPWPGWSRLRSPLLALAPADDALRVADAGCGNGRFGRYLADELSRPLVYTGLDASARLLGDARRALPGSALLRSRWVRCDLVHARLPLRRGSVDCAVAFGLLHHVPGFARRRQLLAELARALRPGGLLAVCYWDFASDPRLAARTVPWSELADPPEPTELEPGDALLRWGAADAPGEGLRYCHASDAREITALEVGLGLQWLDDFRADGRSGRLNRYRVGRCAG